MQRAFVWFLAAGTDTGDADIAGNRQQRRHRVGQELHGDAALTSLSQCDSQYDGKVRISASSAVFGQQRIFR